MSSEFGDAVLCEAEYREAEYRVAVLADFFYATMHAQFHTFLGAFLGLSLLWRLAKRRWGSSGRPRQRLQPPSDDEIERKLAEWQPESLVPELAKDHPSLRPRLVTSRVGRRIVIDGHDCLNLGTHNYLGFLESPDIEETAVATVAKYGVGSCGPRGFYGTADVHLELEARLAEFTKCQEAVVYSYGFSTTASAIPAFCKLRDIVFADERVNFSIQKGLDASRADVKYFRHNDVEHLTQLLETQAQADRKNATTAKKTRRFLVVEGIYLNTGLICPLPELIPLCRKYKLRIFVDESVSFGTLGDGGRGVTEYFQVPVREVDMIMSSLEFAAGSIGGFCVGSSFVVEHHRLSALGYCFSASLPPLLTSAAITALDTMEKRPQLFKKLKNNCRSVDAGLKEIGYFELSGIPESPVKHLYLKEKLGRSRESELLESISEKCIDNKLAVNSAAYLDAERDLPRPSLRICVSAVLDAEDIEFAIKTLKHCAKQVLGELPATSFL